MMAYLILLLGCLAFVLGAVLCLRGRWVLAWMRGTVGLALLVLAVLMIVYGMDLRYYQVLTNEQPVARILITQTGEQQWELQIQSPGEDLTTEIRGDEWQIDARVLRWPATWQALGFDTRYRLERISGRYRDINQELITETLSRFVRTRLPHTARMRKRGHSTFRAEKGTFYFSAVAEVGQRTDNTLRDQAPSRRRSKVCPFRSPVETRRIAHGWCHVVASFAPSGLWAWAVVPRASRPWLLPAVPSGLRTATGNAGPRPGTPGS